jgi:hypothetical protein
LYLHNLARFALTLRYLSSPYLNGVAAYLGICAHYGVECAYQVSYLIRGFLPIDPAQFLAERRVIACLRFILLRARCLAAHNVVQRFGEQFCTRLCKRFI